ncbi:hypothetical protein JXQ70_17375 [bacterium]|nr:hypothetical protein [bacterium]
MSPFFEIILAFLDLLNGRGEIDASLLTTDTVLQDRINRHPILVWKALNVRKYRGLS